MKKKIIVPFMLSLFLLAGCFEDTEAQKDQKVQMAVTEELAKNQPTPTDIDYSLERYNLIKRAYWVNGQREKAISLPSPVDRPLGYIVLFTDAGAPVGRFVVDGKVSSLNSYLTPDSEAYEGNGGTVSNEDINKSNYVNDWLADVDGSYGENDAGIFFFTTDSKYIEWSGTYLYSDIPFEIANPVLTVGVQ